MLLCAPRAFRLEGPAAADVCAPETPPELPASLVSTQMQEGKAEKAADAIKAMLSPTAKVRRNGEVQIVPAEDLVPGDIVLIKSGDKVPADVRLISATNLQVQEAMLTGESVPVAKDVVKPVKPVAPLGDRKNMAYSATAVVAGQGEGIVVATGDSAEIGQISRMVNTVEVVQNNLSRQMDVFGRWLSVVVVFIIVAAFLLARFRAHQDWKDAFESAVSIAVAVIPEGLPAMVRWCRQPAVGGSARSSRVCCRCSPRPPTH